MIMCVLWRVTGIPVPHRYELVHCSGSKDYSSCVGQVISAAVAASCCSQTLSKSHHKLTRLPLSYSPVNPKVTCLAVLFMGSMGTRLRGKMAHSSHPGGVSHLSKHLAHHDLSPSPSRAANALQFLFL